MTRLASRSTKRGAKYRAFPDGSAIRRKSILDVEPRSRDYLRGQRKVVKMLSKISLTVALALGLSTAAHATATFKLLKSFCTDDTCIDGSTPSGTLISDSSHNIYGTTEAGGTIEKTTPPLVSRPPWIVEP
jgi:hypothetical protein